MKNLSLMKIPFCCLAFLLLLAAFARAQPSRNTILLDLEILEEKDFKIIKVHFTFPVRYIRHYPLNKGSEIRIQLRPISISRSDAEALFQSESIPPKVDNSADLLDVVYDGSEIEGRYLTLFFKNAIEFKVEQGDDYRSIQVSIYPDTLKTPALPIKKKPVFYAVNLASAINQFDLDALSTVKVPVGKTLYVTQFKKDGRLWHRLRLGFFSNLENAKQEMNKIDDRFPAAWITKISNEEKKSALAVQDLPKPEIIAKKKPPFDQPKALLKSKTPPPAKPSGPDSSSLLDEADLAMAEQNYRRAIQLYTKLTGDDVIAIREQAQLKLGMAREANSQMAHAKAEYRNYLEQYPQGTGVQEVKKRLDNIMKSGQTVTAGSKSLSGPQPITEISRWREDLYGSFSQFYFYNETSTDANDFVVTRSLLSSRLDATLLLRSDDIKIKSVFVGGHEVDLKDSDDSQSMVRSAFVELDHKSTGHSAQVGRQSGSSGGILGRFDGGVFGFKIANKVSLNLVGGYPVQSTDMGLDTDKYFYGANFDFKALAEHWDVNIFIINQETDRIVDRRAIGAEARHFHSKGSIFSLVDYDIFYDELNTFLLVGNHTLTNGITINFSTDYRQSPSLSTSNAVIGQLGASLDQLIDEFGEDVVQDLARDRSAVFRSATLGITRPINQKLQIASDIAWFNLEGTDASGGVEASSGSGDEFYYSLQMIGNSLIQQGDLAIIGLRYGNTATSDIYTLNINTRYPFTRAWRIVPRFVATFRKNRETSSDQIKLRPSLRTDYRWNKYLHLELEGGMEWSNVQTPGQPDNDSQGFFVLAGGRVRF